jgi:hypothetical protein
VTSLPPDWPLIRHIVRIVHADPCGGLHREALAERLHLPARSRPLGDALGIAYRHKKIDFCGQYVVKPVSLCLHTGDPKRPGPRPITGPALPDRRSTGVCRLRSA